MDVRVSYFLSLEFEPQLPLHHMGLLLVFLPSSLTALPSVLDLSSHPFWTN